MVSCYTYNMDFSFGSSICSIVEIITCNCIFQNNIAFFWIRPVNISARYQNSSSIIVKGGNLLISMLRWSPRWEGFWRTIKAFLMMHKKGSSNIWLKATPRKESGWGTKKSPQPFFMLLLLLTNGQLQFTQFTKGLPPNRRFWRIKKSQKLKKFWKRLALFWGDIVISSTMYLFLSTYT